jgi:hypothetical protein
MRAVREEKTHPHKARVGHPGVGYRVRLGKAKTHPQTPRVGHPEGVETVGAAGDGVSSVQCKRSGEDERPI